jgi:hypothetical protein
LRLFSKSLTVLAFLSANKVVLQHERNQQVEARQEFHFGKRIQRDLQAKLVPAWVPGDRTTSASRAPDRTSLGRQSLPHRLKPH